MIPVISIVSKMSNVGKTTIICKIVEELKNRQYKVATIKHHHRGDFEIDIPGKDSWKHAQAGADIVVLSSMSKIAKIEKTQYEHSLDEILKSINDVDIILTEGYRDEDKFKIEVLRKGMSEEIYSDREFLLCLVSDFEVQDDILQFSFEESEKIVDFLEERFLKDSRDKLE